MGQVASFSAAGAERGLNLQPDLPRVLNTLKTQVTDLGRLEAGQACVWHVIGGQPCFPIPPGYSATCEVYGMACTLLVTEGGAGRAGPPRFLVTTADKRQFCGSSPTAPFAKLALAEGRAEVANGMQAFGFLSSHVQGLLQRAAVTAGLLAEPDIQQAARGWVLPAEVPPAADALASGAAAHGPVAPVALESAFARATSLPLLDNGGAGLGLPPLCPSRQARPSRADSAPTALAEADVQAHAQRPLSRSRRRSTPGSTGPRTSGRGWTAFTAFGLENRVLVRAANPRVSASEVEKLLGQRWGTLDPAEKRKYADMAARVRQTSSGNQAAAEAGQLDLERAGSDAATLGAAEEWPQRAPRPSRVLSSDDYDTTGADATECESDSEVSGDERRMSGLKRKGSHGSAATGARRRKAARPCQAAPQGDDGDAQADSLLAGLLVDMRAEALASEDWSEGLETASAAAADTASGKEEEEGEKAAEEAEEEQAPAGSRRLRRPRLHHGVCAGAQGGGGSGAVASAAAGHGEEVGSASAL